MSEQRVERHYITRQHPSFREVDGVSFASKNLYNCGMYAVRQHFFATGRAISQNKLDKLLKGLPEYQAMPAKVSQLVLKQVADAWESYFKAMKAYALDPSAFLGKPRIPGYKAKNGRNIVTYNCQAVHAQTSLLKGLVHPSGLTPITQTRQSPDRVASIRIVPRFSRYVVEVVYEVDEQEQAELDRDVYAGVDIGVGNLATVTFNRPGMKPFAVSGRELKAINQRYNQRKARLQSLLPKDQSDSKQLRQMESKRYWRIQDIFHKASRFIVDQLVRNKVGTLVIGKNNGWKQEMRMGKRNNQHFAYIPHARFVEMLTYKAEQVGITVVCQEEAHTSKCSFLDLEPICHHDPYLGRRIHRGLFRSSIGSLINADVNGSYNIIRKYNPNVLPNSPKGIRGFFVVHPFRVPYSVLNADKRNQIL